jgi:hypothetical protein
MISLENMPIPANSKPLSPITTHEAYFSDKAGDSSPSAGVTIQKGTFCDKKSVDFGH